MKNISWIGWGIVMYAIMGLVAQITVLYMPLGKYSGVIPLITLIVMGVMGATMMRYTAWIDVLPYALLWLVEILVLDVLLTYPYAGTAMYSDWHLWMNYLLVVLVPVCTPLVRSSRQ